MSTNTAVIGRRSSSWAGADAAAGTGVTGVPSANGVPHAMQNRAISGLSTPHDAQALEPGVGSA